jgi:hypothetical protein
VSEDEEQPPKPTTPPATPATLASEKDANKSRERIALGVIVLGLVFGIYRCTRDPSKPETAAADAAAPSVAGSSTGDASAPKDVPPGLSAPLAAAHAGTDVIVAAFDASAKGIRVQRINAKDEIVADKIVLSDVAWSSDSDLKLAASNDGAGVAVTWRGARAGHLVRQLVLLSGSDLTPKGEPTDVAAASCATRDAVWFSDGSHAVARPWSGEPVKIDLPKDKDASLMCSLHRAFAVLEEDERTSILALGGDAGTTPGKPVTVVRENDFGEDEQRELSEYTVGDDVGVVRLAASGAVMLREVTSAGVVGPMHRLKTTIPKDDDVVVVDATPRVVVIVYTQDAASQCPPASGPGDSVVSTKVTALRVDRQTFEESTVELSPGRCGHEVGPFFTGAVGEGVSVAWAERAGGLGKARAPIVGLAHVVVTLTGTPELARIEQSADALVDAQCDGTLCFAVALARPGVAKVLRYK